jgi:HlyD family secretion protein
VRANISNVKQSRDAIIPPPATWVKRQPKSGRRRWIGWSIACLAILAVGALGTALARRTTTPSYVSAPVVRGQVRQTVDATGTIAAITTVLVGAQVSGTIAALHADFNSRVRQGDLLAEIDPRVYQGQVLQTEADVDNARANLATAAANLVNAKAKAEQARVDYRRAAELARQGLVSPQQLDGAKATADSADAQVAANESMIRQAQAQVSQRQAMLEVAKANLAFTKVYAPVDGTVINRLVDAGQTLASVFQTPTLFTLARDLSKMQLHVSTDEGDIGNVRVGQTVIFRVDAFPGETFAGRVSQIRMNATTVQNVVTYETIVDFENPDHKLFPGMTAYVTVPVASADDVLKVPNAAIRFKPNLTREQLTALLEQNGIDVTDGPADPPPSATSKPGVSTAARNTVVIWKLEPNRKLQPVLIRLGITDRTFTAIAQVLKGNLAANDAVVTDDQKPTGGFGPPRPGGQ